MKRRHFVTLLAGSASIAWPFAVRAQGKIPRIGYLAFGNAASDANRVEALRAGLRALGYVEGKNLVIEFRWAETVEQLQEAAAELVRMNVDVIFASSSTETERARQATSTIPIVFNAADPVEFGLVASLVRPGGNLTGVSMMNTELMAKRVELLSEMVPHPRVIALLVNPNNPGAERIMREVTEAARAKGVQLQILKASTESEIDAVFAALVQLYAGALVVQADPLFARRREQLVALASHHAVPAIYDWREFVAVGGLISYGPSRTDAIRQIGIYVGKILKGAKPADLPVQQPTRFELVVNLNTAKALGLTVPPSILARADEVIE